MLSTAVHPFVHFAYVLAQYQVALRIRSFVHKFFRCTLHSQVLRFLHCERHRTPARQSWQARCRPKPATAIGCLRRRLCAPKIHFLQLPTVVGLSWVCALCVHFVRAVFLFGLFRCLAVLGQRNGEAASRESARIATVRHPHQFSRPGGKEENPRPNASSQPISILPPHFPFDFPHFGM